MSACATLVEATRFAQTRKAATNATVDKASPEIPSLPARTLTNARPTQMFAERTRSVRTPTLDSVANARQGSVGTQTQRARQPKFAPFANQTLTAPTMLSARLDSVSADKALLPLEPSVLMLMSVGQIPRCVALMPCVSTLLAPSPAPACPPLLDHPLPPPALSLV